MATITVDSIDTLADQLNKAADEINVITSIISGALNPDVIKQIEEQTVPELLNILRAAAEICAGELLTIDPSAPKAAAATAGSRLSSAVQNLQTALSNLTIAIILHGLVAFGVFVVDTLSDPNFYTGLSNLVLPAIGCALEIVFLVLDFVV